MIETYPNVTRKEIPPEIMHLITDHHADIYINLFRGVREETPFRIRIIRMETSDHKTRLGHCPGVNIDMLTQGGLALTVAEHRQMQNFAHSLMRKLKDALKLEISTHAGTNLSLSVKKRSFFTDTILDRNLMKWMNLPTGEVIVAPVEDSLNGKLVCDLAIGGIGPIKKPVTLETRNGKVQTVLCENDDTLKRVQASLDTDKMANVVGEFAFGINHKARFVKEFLETEKIYGTVHVAFGANADFPGGMNNSSNHMDFLMAKPTVKIAMENSETITLVADGTFQSL